MTLQRQVAFWFGGLVVLIALLYLLRGILLPFVAGLALAYLLDPLVLRLTQLRVPRALATLLVIGVFVLIFIGLTIVIVPILANQLTLFIARLPGYVVQLQAMATDQNREWLQMVLGERLPDVSRSISDLVSQSVGWIGTFLTSLWSGGAAFISLFSVLVITPVVAFYILKDWPRMISTIDKWLPLAHRATILDLIAQIDRALAGFVRGQASVCLALMIFYGVALSLSGLNFGLLIGISTGLLSFIPYVGSLTGLVISLGVALVQFWPNATMVFVIVAIFVVGQFIEAYVLYPNLVGERVGLHPVWLMFALFAFGYLFGFVGLLIAVPVAAAIGVLTRFGIKQYLASPIYSGGSPPAERP